MEGTHLASVCGMYCGACPVYRVRHDTERKSAERILQRLSEQLEVPVEEVTCEGCLHEGRSSIAANRCEIAQCAASKPGVIRCSDCPDFPCDLITSQCNSGVPHHSNGLRNILRQQQIGVYEWCQEEYERIRCMYCGVSLDWYARTCHRCGTRNANTMTGFLKTSPPTYTYYRA
jgi:hypothetical protein